MARHAPLVGFEGVHFSIQATAGEAVYPDWEWPETDTARHVPGSNITIIQNMGSAIVPITFRLYFDDVDAFFALRRLQGVTGTLTLLAGFTSAVGDRVWTELGIDYEAMDRVRLSRVTGAGIAPGRQYAECTATFLRAMNPLTGRSS